MSHFARRTLSLLLAITMVAGMLPMGVFATEPEEPEQPTPVVEPVTPASSEPAPSESETPTESSEPAPSESETPTESSEPTASEPEEETTLPTETQEDAPKGRAVTEEDEPYLTAQFSVTVGGAHYRYEYYSDGTSKVFDSEDKASEDSIVDGFSYNQETNTLTLEDTTLDILYLSDNGDLTLNLVGSNTINVQFVIRENTNVTLAGEGTLTMKGCVGVYGESTLDMETNHILLDRGSWTIYDDEKVNGDFWYVDGYIDLRVAELYRDTDGSWLMSNPVTTAQCVFMAELSHPVIFYLYTWQKNDDGTYGWDVRPVIPNGGEYWTITPIPEDIKEGAKDGNYYVTLRSRGTLDDVDDVLSYNDVQYKMHVRALDRGFFTQPEWNVSCVLPSQDEYNLSADGDNTIYLLSRTGADIVGAEWSLNNTELDPSEMFTTTRLESGAYRIDFTEKCFDYTDLVLLGTVSFRYNGSEWTGTWNQSLTLVPPADTGDSGSGEESDAPLAARFFVCIDGTWNTYEYYTDGTTRGDIINGFSYDHTTNTLTLTDVDLTWFDLIGGENLANENLTLVLVGENKIREMSVNMGTNLTVRGEGTLEIGKYLYVDVGGHLTLESDDLIYLPNPSALRVDINVSTVTGTPSYREGTSYIGVRRLLGQNEDGFYLEDETYRPIEEFGIMGMQEECRIFYSCVYENGEWVMTPVIPTVSEAPERLSVTKCTDVTATGLTEAEKAAVVKVQSLDLGGYGSGKSRAYLSIDGEDYDFTLYNLNIAYYSSTQPTPGTYLPGESQHFFYANDGDSFYCIIRTTSTGIAIRGDITWKFFTWGQDYSFIPGIEKNEDLVVIEDLEYDANGNRVFKITPSDAYAAFMNYGYNWKNFSIAPVVTWEYTGNPGEMGFCDYWEMWINPPQDTMQPVAFLRMGENEYQLYEDGAIFQAVEEDGNEHKEFASLPGVTFKNGTLTLDGADLTELVMEGENTNHLNIHVASDSTISSIRIHGENSITVTCEEGASLTVTDALRVFDATRLSLTDGAVTLGVDCETEIWGIVNGELAYEEGYAQVILYALWDERLEDDNGQPILDEKNNEQYVPVLHGPYTLEEYCLTGMYPQALLFYSKVMGEDGWEMTPVVPNSSELEFTAYQGSIQHEHSAFLRNVTSYTLGNHRVTLTVGDKTYEWYVDPTPVGFFSGPEATVENYLKGDSQYFFDTTVDGENTFYFIALEGKCGYTLNGDISWDFNTWGQDYADFMGLEPNEDLVTITQLEDDPDGNKVWQITVSDAFVDYVKYSYNWKNFSLLISANWIYPDGNPGGIVDYGMFINPPQQQVPPKAAFCIDYAEYFIYEDDAIFCRDWNDDWNFVKITEENYPEGVSYDVDTNTMTLDNAHLKMLYLEYDNSWEDEDGTFHDSHMLPTNTVTLNLVGKNTLVNDYANGIQLAGGANLAITGSGSLDIHVTNHFEQVPAEYGGGVARYLPVFLSSTSNLTIGGSAAVTLVSDYDTDALQEWLFGIDSEGGTSSLTLKESASLNIQMPDGMMFKYSEDGNSGFLPIQTNHDSNSGLCAITIQDDATLTTDSMNLRSCVYTQTGGTWNIYTNPTNAEGQAHDGLYTENATLDISGGELNIIGRYENVEGLEDYTFFGIQLVEGSQMNVSGGKVNIKNCFNQGQGIVAYANEGGPGGTLNVTGGTINLLSDKKDGLFHALGVYGDPNASRLCMSGGTINAEGRMFPNSLYMEGGEINLTGLTGSGWPAIFQVASGYITGGTIHISNATFKNIMNFSIDGGVIDIDNTEDTTGLGEEEWPLVGLRNELYLPINGGTITIQTANAAAIENCGTFHQMGGTITATSDTIGVANSGEMLLNSGTLALSGGDRGVEQWFDATVEGENGGIFVPEFQVGGGETGDHNLTITGGNVGLLAMGGRVQFTGQAKVEITVPEGEIASGEAAGIYLFDNTGGVCSSGLTIDGRANVDIHCLRELGTGLYSASPVSIIGNQAVCPTLTIQAEGSAVFFGSSQEELNLLTMEGLGFASTSSGRRLSSWSHENRIGNSWYHYLLDGDGYATSVTTEANTIFAEFTISPYTYRVTEQDGQQIVEVKPIFASDSEYVPGELPEGVAYDLATNTMTLSNKKALDWLNVTYLVKDENGNEVPCLPTPDFTIQLKNKNTSLYMLTLDGQINATITGSGTLKLMDSASINGELTIAKGVTLVNDVTIGAHAAASTEYSVGGPAKLTVVKGATLTNNGLLIVDGQDRSTVDIQGKFSQGSKGQTWVGWDQRGNVNIAKNLQTLICDITTEQELNDILAEETLSSYKHVRVYVHTMTLEEAHTIPKNTSLRVNYGGTLTIGEAAELTIAGTLVLDEYDDCALENRGTLRIAKGGTMSMDGNFSGIAPVNEGGKITPQASKLKVTAENNVTSFDLFYMEELTTTLTVAVTTKDTKVPLNRVTWKSSNEKIVKAADIVDNQDGTYKVTFAGGVGKVTLTATTIDGAKKTATVNLTVAYLDGKLTATQKGSYSAKFLQVGETATMAVTVGEVSLNELNEALETNVVTFKSSNAKIAEVDPETGVITGIKTGTAKITATMAVPGDKRTVSIDVKVVVPQILQLQLREGMKNEDKTITSTGELYSYEEGVEGNTTFNLSTFNGKAKDLYIFPEALTWSAEGGSDYEPAVANKLKWTCSDTSIATVKANKDYATVTVKAKAHGVFTITATATDTNKAVASMTFIVMDYKPRLSNPSITLNPKQEGGVKLDLVESYGNTIYDVWLEGKNADRLTIDSETYCVEAADELKNQTIKPTLFVDTSEGVYEIPLTVTIKNSTPKITVTQYDKLELGYIGGTHIDVTSSIGEVYRVELAGDSSPDILLKAWYYHDDGCDTVYNPEMEYNYMAFSLQTSDNCASKINTKVKLKVHVTGYQDPIDYSFTPKTTTTKITVTTTPTASVINGNAAEYTASFGLKTTIQGETWDLGIWGDEIKDYYNDYHKTDDDVYQYGWKAQVLKVTYNNTELPFEVVNDTIRLTFSKEEYPKGFNGTVKVEIRYPYWSQHKTISHKISTSTKAPTVTTEKSTLTLYSLFPERYAWTTASLNQSNLTLDSIDTPTCTNKEGQKLYMEVYVPGDTGVAYINAYFNQNEEGSYTIPKDGTYTFNTVAHYTDPVTEATKDVKFSFKVKVTSTSPTVKLSSNTIKLNTALAGNEEEGKSSQEEGYVYAKITYNDAWTLSNNGNLALVGYEVDGHKVFFQDDDTELETEATYEDKENGIRFRGQGYYQDKLYNEGCNGVLFAELTRKTATKHTYTVYPIVHEYTTDTEKTLYKNKLSLTVQPHSGKLSVTQSASGKLDLLTPETPVIYTIKKVNNAYCDDLQVTLLKKDGKDYVPYETGEEPLFDLYVGATTQSGKNYQTVYLFLNQYYTYTADKTEQFKFRYTIGDVSFDSPVLSLKINRSTPKITASTVNYYQAEGVKVKDVQLRMTSPAGATIGRVEFNEKKTSKELLAALAAIDPSSDYYGDGENGTLYVEFANPSALKAGKTYYLYLDIYPTTPAQTAEKPTTVKVTVKVAK